MSKNKTESEGANQGHFEENGVPTVKVFKSALWAALRTIS